MRKRTPFQNKVVKELYHICGELKIIRPATYLAKNGDVHCWAFHFTQHKLKDRNNFIIS